MTNDHSVRVIALSDFDHVEHFDLSVGGHTVCVSKDQAWQERSAAAIRKAIEDAHMKALDEAIVFVAEAWDVAEKREVIEGLEQLKERDDAT